MTGSTTPAGEAMREAVAHWFLCRFPISLWQARGMADALLSTGPIASELARLTAERDKLQRAVDAYRSPPRLYTLADMQGSIDRADAAEERASAAEAALTTKRADHAAEVARLTEALRFYADEDAWSGQPWRLQFESPGRDGHGSDTARDALATTETTDA